MRGDGGIPSFVGIVLIAIAAAILALVLVGCQEPEASTLPGAERVGETSNGKIEVWKDPSRPVVCYSWDGYETDGFSCVVIEP